MKKPDPYADLAEVYAEETSFEKYRVKPTPKTPTGDLFESTEQEKVNPVLPNGMRIE